MTQVLVLMYLADLASGISVVSALVALTTLCAWIVRWLAALNDDLGDGAVVRTMPSKKALWVIVATLCLSAAMPSKTTMYAAAAVSAGDALVASERGAKVLRLLDSWLDEQTAPKEQE